MSLNNIRILLCVKVVSIDVNSSLLMGELRTSRGFCRLESLLETFPKPGRWISRGVCGSVQSFRCSTDAGCQFLEWSVEGTVESSGKPKCCRQWLWWLCRVKLNRYGLFCVPEDNSCGTPCTHRAKLSLLFQNTVQTATRTLSLALAVPVRDETQITHETNRWVL